MFSPIQGLSGTARALGRTPWMSIRAGEYCIIAGAGLTGATRPAGDLAMLIGGHAIAVDDASPAPGKIAFCDTDVVFTGAIVTAFGVIEAIVVTDSSMAVFALAALHPVAVQGSAVALVATIFCSAGGVFVTMGITDSAIATLIAAAFDAFAQVVLFVVFAVGIFFTADVVFTFGIVDAQVGVSDIIDAGVLKAMIVKSCLVAGRQHHKKAEKTGRRCSFHVLFSAISLNLISLNFGLENSDLPAIVDCNNRGDRLASANRRRPGQRNPSRRRSSSLSNNLKLSPSPLEGDSICHSLSPQSMNNVICGTKSGSDDG